jgi:hypothetical protein
VPPKEIIEDIIKSGLMAPYAGISGIPVNEILTETMSKNKDFANLLELPYGEFELDGCAIGYSDQIPLEKKSFSVNEVIKWL